MAYKLKSQGKFHVITVRICDEDYKTVKKITNKLKVSQADFFRHAITEESQKAIKELF